VAGLRFWARRTLYQRAFSPLDIGPEHATTGRSGRYGAPRVEQRTERIIIETDRHRIVGHLMLPADGYRSRLTDYLNAAEREFLALTDVEVTNLQGTPRVEKRDFIALSLRHVVLAMPAEDDVAS
jgi:hypothetical protein